ncbi:MAG: flagellar hook-basal body complex protein FliE [Dehalococcoidia bacterium]
MQISGITPNPIPGIGGIGAPSVGSEATSSGGASFGDMLAGLAQQSGLADNAVENLSVGGDMDLHDVTLAAELESISFELAVEIRNKLVDAYTEIFRMSI